MISRDPSEALQGLVHVFEGLGRYTDPGIPGNVMLPLIKLAVERGNNIGGGVRRDLASCQNQTSVAIKVRQN